MSVMRIFAAGFRDGWRALSPRMLAAAFAVGALVGLAVAVID